MLDSEGVLKRFFFVFCLIITYSTCLILTSCNFNSRGFNDPKYRSSRTVNSRPNLDTKKPELVLYILKQVNGKEVILKTDLETFTHYLNKDITNSKHSSKSYEVKRSEDYQRLLDTITHEAKTSKTINVENIAKAINYIQKFGIMEDEYFNNMIGELLSRSLCVVYHDSKVVTELRIETFSGFDAINVTYYINNTDVKIWQSHF